MKFILTLKLNWVLALIIAANIFVLIGTWIQHYHFYNALEGDWSQASRVEYIILQFSLHSENTIATWYSSKLLFLVALMSFLCFLIQQELNKKDSKFLSYGWLMFFILFTTLSYDEIASMHERIGNIDALNPFGDGPPGWIILLTIPIFVVGVLMLWFCWKQLKTAPYAVLFASIGIMLFLSVPAQEYLETNAWLNSANPDTWERPVHFLLLEEGSELFGATFMLFSTVLFSHSATRSRGKRFISDKLKIAFYINKNNCFRLLIAILILLGLVMILVERSTLLDAEGDIGISRNWFPSVTAFLAALFSLYIFYKRKESDNLHHSVFLLLAIFCLFLSCYYGSYIYVYLWKIEGGLIHTLFLIISWIITLILGISLLNKFKDLLRKAGIVLWTVTIIIVLALYNEYSAVLAYIGFSFLILTQVSLIFSNKKMINTHEQLLTP